MLSIASVHDEMICPTNPVPRCKLPRYSVCGSSRTKANGVLFSALYIIAIHVTSLHAHSHLHATLETAEAVASAQCNRWLIGYSYAHFNLNYFYYYHLRFDNHQETLCHLWSVYRIEFCIKYSRFLHIPRLINAMSQYDAIAMHRNHINKFGCSIYRSDKD